MKKIIVSFLLLTSTVLFGQTRDYPIQAVNFKLVQLADNFWLPKIKINQNVTIPLRLKSVKIGSVQDLHIITNECGTPGFKIGMSSF